MKMVLKSKTGYYVQVNGKRKGEWQSVDSLERATVFDIDVGTGDEPIVVTPPFPFDSEDDREHMLAYRMVAVRAATIVELTDA